MTFTFEQLANKIQISRIEILIRVIITICAKLGKGHKLLKTGQRNKRGRKIETSEVKKDSREERREWRLESNTKMWEEIQ